MATFLFLVLVFSHFAVAKDDKPFVIVQSVSALYFCFFGYWYWVYARNYEFLGGYWSEDLPRSRDILCFYTSIVILAVVYFGRRSAASPSPFVDFVFPKAYFSVMLCAGFFGGIYIVYSSVVYGGLNPNDSVALLIGQFADLLIPCILFYIAANGWSWRSIVAVLLFIAFAVFIGYRTRIVLVVGPLLLFYWMGRNVSFLGRVLFFFLLSLTALLFSVMTFSREKFNSLDFDKVMGANYSDLLEGLFAESNILFGLIGVMTEFVDRGNYVYFQPVYDSLIEFIPRFIYPDKSTGEYLVTAVLGLLADNAVQSGTAYPFVGEYLLMGGHVLAFFMCILLGFICVRLRSVVIGISAGSVASIGVYLLALFFGYYYYSRGYLPQMTKFFIFIVCPYLILAGKSFSIKIKK